MSLVSLKMSKKDRQAEMQPSPADQNPYPYGARLSLDTDELKKLGITAKNLPEVGEYYHIEARGCITSVSQDNNRISVGIQIEDMALADEDAAEDEAEDRAKGAESGAVGGKAKTLLTSAYRGK
jgi:hypothetical protein